MRFKTVTGLLLAAVLVLSGCAATGDETHGGAGGAGASGGSGAATLEFAGETLDGASYNGQQLAGKPAVLWFWAPWCPTCRAQAGHVETIAAEYSDEVSVVGVGGLADTPDIEDFARQVEGPTHLIDPEGEIWRHFEVTAQSTYVVLDADGEVVSEGYLDNEELSSLVAELVG